LRSLLATSEPPRCGYRQTALDARVAIGMLCYCGRHLMRDEEGVLACAVCKLPPPRCRCLPLGVG
jgi:hypothetical protein